MYQFTKKSKRYLKCGLIIFLIFSLSNIQYINSSTSNNIENLQNTVVTNQSNTIIEDQNFTGDETLQIIGADNVTIRGNVFIDNSDFSITISNSQNIMIVDNEFSTKKAIKISSSENIQIINNKVEESIEGINIVDCHEISVVNNDFKSGFDIYQETPNYGIRMIEESLRLPKPITIINITQNIFIGFVDAISGTNTVDLSIENNYFSNNHRSIILPRTQNSNISNNVMEQGSNLEVYISGTDDIVARGDFLRASGSYNIQITNNIISVSPHGTGISLDTSNNTKIMNNTIYNTAYGGILLLDTDHTVISNNDISNIESNLETPGIEVLNFRKDSLVNLNISQNTISEIKDGNALTVQNMINASIARNEFMNIHGSGIELLGTANSVTISNNIFRDITRYGIEFSTSEVHNITIHSNEFHRIRLSPIHNADESVQIYDNSYVQVNMLRNQLILGGIVISLIGISIFIMRKRKIMKSQNNMK